MRVAEQQAAIGFVPRNTPVQVHFDAALAEHRFHVAHGRKSALRENVHLNEADGFHRVHVKVRRGVALVGDEGRRQLVQRLA